jgi:hypothetical protein
MGAPKIFENLIQAKRLHSLSAPASRIQVYGQAGVLCFLLSRFGNLGY